MRYIFSIIALAWIVLLGTNSEILINESPPAALEKISRLESNHPNTSQIIIKNVGRVTVREPITDGELRQIIRRLTQYQCKYFTGRKVISRPYPKYPTPENVPAHSCPNVRWFNVVPEVDSGPSAWIADKSAGAGLLSGGIELERNRDAGLFPEVSTLFRSTANKIAEYWDAAFGHTRGD